MASLSDEDTPVFKNATIGEIFKLVNENDTRVTEGALHLSAEYLRLFVIESLHRSVEIAKQEQSDLDMVRLGGPDKTNGEVQLKVSHLEQVITGVILDF